ncbi:unnamed protein product [Cyclocybe aegerita]|uniref:F-box domain-containing protein n=1 Tax=Cyclocybe aegerita TaxID=1973307 RepID=A0A8S0WAD6_CYCAE|nr:unnamed protein product [Cyclocybe aegerita]
MDRKLLFSLCNADLGSNAPPLSVTTMFDSLPFEIILQILAYLPVSSLSSLSSISHSWNDFFAKNETAIYRESALLHGFADQRTTEPDHASLSKRYSNRVLNPGFTWKKLCETRVKVRNAWSGCAASTVISLPTQMPNAGAFPTKVHRIKVDEQRGFLMITSQEGGLFVMDVDTGTFLFALSQGYVHEYAHIEYSEGYMIFDRLDNSREVWRLQDIEATDALVDEESQPDQFQIEEFEMGMHLARYVQLTRSSDVAQLPLRGCFEPYALLTAPEVTRCSRFVYPTLLAASLDRVYLWDVPTGRVMEVLEGLDVLSTDTALPLEPVSNSLPTPDADEAEEYVSPPTESLEAIVYVDHSVNHVFLAGRHAVRVFDKARVDSEHPSSSSSNSNAHQGRVVLNLWSTHLRAGRWSYSPRYGSGVQEEGSALVHYEVDFSERQWVRRSRRLIDEFIAVHVSPCGLHFAALLSGCRLLLVSNFKRMNRNPRTRAHEVELYNTTLDIRLGSPRSARSIYLAYEAGDAGEGRIGVVTSSAVFVVIVPPLPVPEAATLPVAPPKIRIARVKEFMNPSSLSSVSCLMLSDTGLFLNWDGGNNDSEDEDASRDWEEAFEESLRDSVVPGEDNLNHTDGEDIVISPDIPDQPADASIVHAVNFLPLEAR